MPTLTLKAGRQAPTHSLLYDALPCSSLHTSLCPTLSKLQVKAQRQQPAHSNISTQLGLGRSSRRTASHLDPWLIQPAAPDRWRLMFERCATHVRLQRSR